MPKNITRNFCAVGNRIWKYRNARGLKQADLAFLLGQESAAQVSRYERGVVMPKIEQLYKLCCALDVGVESLYPDLVEDWRREVEARSENKTMKNHETGKQAG